MEVLWVKHCPHRHQRIRQGNRRQHWLKTQNQRRVLREPPGNCRAVHHTLQSLHPRGHSASQIPSLQQDWTGPSRTRKGESWGSFEDSIQVCHARRLSIVCHSVLYSQQEPRPRVHQSQATRLPLPWPVPLPIREPDQLVQVRVRLIQVLDIPSKNGESTEDWCNDR